MIGRLLLYAAIAFLLVIVLGAAFVLQRGGSSSEAVTQVSVHDLATFTERYEGERVTTVGVLRRFTEPEEHFVVEDDDLRVAVTGYNRNALLALEGQTVTVTGSFGVEDGTGRYVDAESVTPLR